jgi:hypothetical protein
MGLDKLAYLIKYQAIQNFDFETKVFNQYPIFEFFSCFFNFHYLKNPPQINFKSF